MSTKGCFKDGVRAGFFALLLLSLLVPGLLTVTQHLHAQAGGAYDIVWSAVTTTAIVQGGSYRADVTVGQSEVGVQSGGSYDLGGGFWGDTTPDVTLPAIDASIYLPIVVR